MKELEQGERHTARTVNKTCMNSWAFEGQQRCPSGKQFVVQRAHRCRPSWSGGARERLEVGEGAVQGKATYSTMTAGRNTVSNTKVNDEAWKTAKHVYQKESRKILRVSSLYGDVRLQVSTEARHDVKLLQ